jgi:hypothetical protein
METHFIILLCISLHKYEGTQGWLLFSSIRYQLASRDVENDADHYGLLYTEGPCRYRQCTHVSIFNTLIAFHSRQRARYIQPQHLLLVMLEFHDLPSTTHTDSS